VDVTQAIDLIVDGAVGLELDGRRFHNQAAGMPRSAERFPSL
jgi:hypothetical protein